MISTSTVLQHRLVACAAGALAAVALAAAFWGATISDVRLLCCPSACAVKRDRMQSDANRVLRACMRSLGARGEAATVGMVCGCEP